MCVFFFRFCASVAVESSGRNREDVLRGTSRAGQATLRARVCGKLPSSSCGCNAGQQSYSRIYDFFFCHGLFKVRDEEFLRQQEERRKANSMTETESRMRGTTVSPPCLNFV